MLVCLSPSIKLSVCACVFVGVCVNGVSVVLVSHTVSIS